jgi:hypothetical protein
MRRRLREVRQDIVSPSMKDNETWNDCPDCGKSWKDETPTPGLIHRTRQCYDCAIRPRRKSDLRVMRQDYS